jgi:hypothetical protein
VSNASVTDVYINISGMTTGIKYTVNGITPVVGDYRFRAGEDVYVSSSGTLNNAIIEYILVGEEEAYVYTRESQFPYSGAIASGWYRYVNDGRSGDGQRKWPVVVQSGSYRTTY